MGIFLYNGSEKTSLPIATKAVAAPVRLGKKAMEKAKKRDGVSILATASA